MKALILSSLAAVGQSFWGWLGSTMAFLYGNMCIMLGLIFGALILLRPVTNRLIAPRWRLPVWFTGWYCGFLIQVYALIGNIGLLPISFRSLIVPRTTDYGGNNTFPSFLPDVSKAGDYSVILPGGAELPVSISEAALGAIVLLWLGSFTAVLIRDCVQNRRLRAIGQQGIKMDEEQRAKYGIDRNNVVVRLCKNLPTSFVRFGNDEHIGDGIRFVICIQDDLNEEQMRLVLLHEMEHIRLHHAWWKSTMTVVLYIFWWNPVLWAAYRLTCRDMELACDEAVMAKLNDHDRREYARTLVELGAGKPLWGAATSFGECDAVLRVRNVVNWKPRADWSHVVSIGLAVVLILFFYGGSIDQKALENRIENLNWINYATGAGFEQDFQRFREYHYEDESEVRLEERWERTERTTWLDGGHTLLVRDNHDQWYICRCVPIGDAGYYIQSCNTVPGEPNMDGFRGIVIPG